MFSPLLWNQLATWVWEADAPSTCSQECLWEFKKSCLIYAMGLTSGPVMNHRVEPHEGGKKGPFLPFLCWHCEALLSAQAHCSAGSSSGAKSLLTWGENAPSSQLMHREQDSELLLLLTVPPPAPADYSRTADAFFWKTAGLSRCGMRITLLFDSWQHS